MFCETAEQSKGLAVRAEVYHLKLDIEQTIQQILAINPTGAK